MTPDRLFVLTALALSACGTSASPGAATTSGSEVETTQSETTAESSADAGTGDDTGAPVDAAAPDDLTTFSAPVRVRLEALPSLPVRAGTPILTLTLFDASLICGFLDENVRHQGAVSASCPDGSPVLLGGECNPASVIALRRTFGEACALRFGDYLACEIAARESPCSVGFMRADLPECEAVNACLATQVPSE